MHGFKGIDSQTKRISFVGSYTVNGATPVTVDFAGLGIRAGDYALIVSTSSSGGTYYTNISAGGWTREADGNVSYVPGSLFSKTLTGAETTLDISGPTSTTIAAMLLIFRRVDPPHLSDTSVWQSVFQFSSPPNPPLLSSGSVVEDDYVLAIGMMSAYDLSVTAPAGFTLLDNNGDSGAGSIMAAWATGLTGSIDPGAFGGIAASPGGMSHTIYLKEP